MTDTVLINRFLEGDIQAFNMLVWRWEKPIYNFVYRFMGSEDITKDICQMTFIRVYKELKRLRNPEAFKQWIYRIAHNLCKDEFKKRKNRKNLSIHPVHDEEMNRIEQQFMDEGTKNPDALCHVEIIGSILRDALNQLPVEQRVVVVMKQYHDLKFNEIADILNEPINTIKSRLYYGLRALKKILESSDLNKEALLYEM